MADSLDRHWRLWVLLFWVVAMGLLLYARANAIHWFGLGDTDDNMRIMQVRALLDGQGWYDLRQYRFDPPYGADIHWSRIVDLPIAGIILALRPFVDGATAEKVAVALAPMLPMGIAFAAVAVAVRRTVSPLAYPLALALLMCAHSTRGMFVPLRIDHHGWQLATLALAVAAFTDPRRVRGGLVAGAATALSLAIGLELLVYLAVAGIVVVLLWVRDEDQAPRLAAYGASLGGGCALGYLLFASYANQAPVCDALSPVWLSAMVCAGALAVLLSRLRGRGWPARLVLAAAGGALIAGCFALAWPKCLGRPEGASPELAAMWLDHVREARPIYVQSWEVVLNMAVLPIAGLAGYAMMIWRTRADREACLLWGALGAVALTAAALLLWQMRAGPAAQLLSIPGATALAWLAMTRALAMESGLAGAVLAGLAFFLVSGTAVQEIPPLFAKPVGRSMKAVNVANAECPTLPALHPVALIPKGYVLTFVDLGPRLITVTHHDAVGGPYHRNGRAILDIMHAFRGSPDAAHAIVARRGIDYVLICPGLSESTVYAKETPNGFYAQLARGKAPDWLARIALPSGSPYRMWRVLRR